MARTDATEEGDILRRAQALAETDADVVLVDGVRDVEWIRRIRKVINDKPLLFNQIAGGKSPRLSLSELTDLECQVAIYSTPCLFAAHTAIDTALSELRKPTGGSRSSRRVHRWGCGSTELLERNISRHHPAEPRLVTA